MSSKLIIKILRNGIYQQVTASKQRSTRLKILGILTILSLVILTFILSNSYVLRNQTAEPQLLKTRNLSQFILNRQQIHQVQQPKICRSDVENIPIIYFVTTTSSHARNRNAIRQTWGKSVRPKPIFMVGITDDKYKMERIINEANIYRDIIIENFIDSYYNLTLKTAFILKNYLELCPRAKYLMKVDDDMFINPRVIESIVRQWTDSKEQFDNAPIIGRLFESYKPHRYVGSKWYLSYDMYNQSLLPPYVSGTSYLVPGSIVQDILDTALNVSTIPLEDVYFTGMIGHNKLSVNLLNENRFRDDKPLINYHCLFRPLATAHQIKPEILIELWNDLHDREKQCNGSFYQVRNFIFGLV